MSVATYEIPLSANNQTLSVVMNGVTYNLRVIWNTVEMAWVLDIYDVNNNPILTAIPLVSGRDLLEQYDYLGIGGGLVAYVDNDPNDSPSFTNLGTTGHLIFCVTD